MNTKQTLLNIMHLTPSLEEMIAQVNFPHLENYVWHQLSSFLESRGADSVRYDLYYDVQTPTDTFIVDLVEAGSLELLVQNNLEQSPHFIDALYVIISAINLVIADFLQQKNIASLASYRYLDADPQYVSLLRVVEQLQKNKADLYFLHPGTGMIAC